MPTATAYPQSGQVKCDCFHHNLSLYPLPRTLSPSSLTPVPSSIPVSLLSERLCTRDHLRTCARRWLQVWKYLTRDPVYGDLTRFIYRAISATSIAGVGAMHVVRLIVDDQHVLKCSETFSATVQRKLNGRRTLRYGDPCHPTHSPEVVGRLIC